MKFFDNRVLLTLSHSGIFALSALRVPDSPRKEGLSPGVRVDEGRLRFTPMTPVEVINGSED